jgi:hypothetical protein
LISGVDYYCKIEFFGDGTPNQFIKSRNNVTDLRQSTVLLG